MFPANNVRWISGSSSATTRSMLTVWETTVVEKSRTMPKMKSAVWNMRFIDVVISATGRGGFRRGSEKRAAKQRSELSPGRGFASPGRTSEVCYELRSSDRVSFAKYDFALSRRSQKDFAIRKPHSTNINGDDSVRR